MPRAILRHRVLICLLSLFSLIPAFAGPGAGAQVTPSVPNLRIAVLPPQAGLLAVEGERFSPGGLVYIAMYDRWGVDVYQHFWTVASHGSFGPNGSQDPALGYVPAGTVNEVIALYPAATYGPNGSQDPAHGYQPGVTAVQEPAATYGPNGSQDPALGYVPAAGQASSAATCGGDLMVRAYDQRTSTWSNLIDVTAGC
jgi:hypothetical protein